MDGETGEDGLLVIGTLDGNPEGGNATILLLKMEGMIVKETTRKIVFVMEGGV